MSPLKALSLTILLSIAVAIHAQKKSAIEKPNNRIINIDIQKVKGSLNTMFKECIGAGRANEGLRADWQRQLAYVKEQCGFKYIRMHGLVTDDMGVYFEDKAGNPVYNWQYIDELFDFIIGLQMKPFVELGFMPNALASGKETIFWWKGNITPPKDYAKWASLIENLVTHFKERYGDEEVKTWYFEVWNEPNLKDIFFTGDMQTYFKLYTTTSKVIKKVNKLYRVGGPATAGSAWIPEFIEFCSKNDAPVDFVSTHTYGVDQGFVDKDGNRGTVLSKDPNSVSGEIIRSRDQILQSAKPDLQLHYTEWSSSYTPADPIHDSYHQAAYVLQKIKQVGNAANSMSYWVFTDIFEENGPRTSPFHGGFGLLNYQSIKKPAFFSYQFLNKLGDNELENNDGSSWACKDAKGNIQVLLWDFTNTHPGDSVNNQVYYKRDLPSKPKGIVKIKIDNVTSGKYRIDIYKVGYRSNDAYSTYLDLGAPKQLTPKEVETIKQLNDGKPYSSSIIQFNTVSSFEKEFSLHENDVLFLVMNKLEAN